MMKKNDLILVGIVLVLGIAVVLFFNLTKSEGSKLLVTINGKEYNTFDLNKDTTFTVEQENGDWNKFVIKDGIVDMVDANCPDKLCVNHKNIHYNHETIVCLPNKVVLEVINGEANEVDMIAN
jgi:hypothetical protein